MPHLLRSSACVVLIRLQQTCRQQDNKTCLRLANGLKEKPVSAMVSITTAAGRVTRLLCWVSSWVIMLTELKLCLPAPHLSLSGKKRTSREVPWLPLPLSFCCHSTTETQG